MYSHKGVVVVDHKREVNADEFDAEYIQEVHKERDHYFIEDPHGRYESSRTRGGVAYATVHHVRFTAAEEEEEGETTRENVARLLRAVEMLQQQVATLGLETRSDLNSLNEHLMHFENISTVSPSNMVEDDST